MKRSGLLARSDQFLTAKFLYRLGLRKFPPLNVILNLAASPDSKIRTLAMNYFLDNYVTRYSDYEPGNFATVAFVPALDGKVQKLATPNEVSLHGLHHAEITSDNSFRFSPLLIGHCSDS